MKYLPLNKLTKFKFDFEVGYLVKSPCKECEKRTDFPNCIDDCDKIDKIHEYLLNTISCTRSA